MQRYDTTVKLANGNTFHVVNLLDCTAGTVTTLDPALKIYTVNQSTQVRPEVLGIGTLLPSFSPDGRGFMFPEPDLRIASQTGAVGVSVGVSDKGMASIGKTKNAHHYTISLVYSTSGGAAVPYAAQLFDVWTDDTQKQSANCIAGPIHPGRHSRQGRGGRRCHLHFYRRYCSAFGGNDQLAGADLV